MEKNRKRGIPPIFNTEMKLIEWRSLNWGDPYGTRTLTSRLASRKPMQKVEPRAVKALTKV
jgi:hypothetical protein